MASRTQNPDQAELAALLDDGAVVRTHVLRSTWHFVRAEDAGWLLDLTGPRVRRVTGQQLRNAHGLDERSIGHAVTAVAEALASREHLIRDNTDRLRRIWSLVRLLTCDFWSGWPEPAASSSRTERAVQRNHCYLVSPLVTRIA